jgi:hypothetical protein
MYFKLPSLLLVPFAICLSGITLFGQLPGPGERVVIFDQTVDTIYIFDPATFTETVEINVYTDTIVIHHGNKVELRRQKRPHKDIPHGENLSILERNHAVRDTIIIYNPENRKISITFPSQEDE